MTMTEYEPTIPISVASDILEAYRHDDPKFCEFLEETGRLSSFN
jgi:hypothetical protein